MKYKFLLTIIIIILLPGNVYANATYNPAKGLAMASANMEDLTSLGISWWYTWGENCNANSAPGCINMVRSMQLPTACYDVLLVGNEPNAKEPWGAPITPTDAVRKVRAIQLQCPATKLIVGNVSADDWSNYGGWGSGYNWLAKFLKEYKRLYHRSYTGALSGHCYAVQTAQWCIDRLNEYRNIGVTWITEFACIQCSQAEFSKLLDAAATFSYYSIYTNRQPRDELGNLPSWGIQGVDLANQDGSLTPNGTIYASR